MNIRELIYSSLRVIGQLAEGETPSAATFSDSLLAFNQLIDSWNTERLSVYCLAEHTFTWNSDDVSVTVGPSGDVDITRPIKVDYATCYVMEGISYPLYFINQEQYSDIPSKDLDGAVPRALLVTMNNPDITLTLYPKPSQDIEFHLFYTKALPYPVTAETELSLPAGYLRALKFALAVEIACEFGVEPSSTVKKIADNAKRNLERINSPPDVLSMPFRIFGNGNIYNGWGGFGG